MSEQEMNTLELTIEQAREKISLMETLKRLEANPDFHTVMLKGYFEGEAVRLVHAKGNPGMTSPESQASIIKQIDAIGSLGNYFRSILHNGLMSAKAIEDAEETKDEILREELNK